MINRKIWVLVLSLPAIAVTAGAQTAAHPLTSAAAIWRLKRPQAAPPVYFRLRGQVLAYAPSGLAQFPVLILRQANTGLQVRLSAPVPGLAPGNLVQVRGSQIETFPHPHVIASGIKILGQAPLPAASSVALDDLRYGMLDGRWARLQGVAVRVELKRGGTRLILMKDGVAGRVWLAGPWMERPQRLIGARVSVRGGVLCRWQADHWVTDLISTPANLAVITPGPADPFSLPVMPLSRVDQQLRSFPRLIHVHGVATVQQPWGAVTIQSGNRGLYLRGYHLPRLNPCQQVEAAGFPISSGSTVILQDAMLRPGAAVKCPAPIRVLAGERLNPAWYDRRLEVSGKLYALHLTPQHRAQSLSLLAGNRMFYVEFAWPGARAWASKLLPGMGLRVRGAYYATLYAGQPELALYPGRAADIQILSYPPWWTATRQRWLLALLVLAMLLAFGGAMVYKIQVRRIGRLVEIRTREQRELEKQLQQARHMEALGRLTAGVAHDFNNILTIILGRTELLLAKAGNGETLQQLKIISDSGQRAARLTRQLLAYGRRQALQLESVNLNSVVRGMGDMLRALMGEAVRVELRLAPQLDPVMADAGQISQVIMNLAANALDAMPQGGVLEIETANCQLSATEAALYGSLAPGHYVRLSFRDNGVGMPPQIRDHVFEPFFTTKGEGQGTGLGLASAYGIISQSQGGIRVESAVGRGTVFHIVLPRAASASAARHGA